MKSGLEVKTIRKCPKIAALLLLSLLLSPCFAADPGFDQAVNEYKARQYSQSLSHFRALSTKYPADAQTRYYMALCYQATNQISMAKSQYEWVASNSRDPRLQGYAQSALGQLGKYASTVGSASPQASGVPPGAMAMGAPVKVAGRLKVLEFSTDW